jgi:hypothetical protein
MLMLTREIDTFPSIRLASHSGGLPVEVTLITQLGHGSGNHVVAAVAARQRAHPAFVDALDEPSTRLGGVDLARGDATSLYSFVVGAQGHPFHRHAGHRMFTAISGSSGARLRFSTASDAQLAEDPRHFLRAMHCVDIPPDCLFTVRFGGDTWHQFLPLSPGSRHPALFALSCHTNELGGDLTPEQQRQVADDAADIPSLTELLPAAVIRLLESADFDAERVPTVALSLTAPARSMASRACAWIRGGIGRVRGALGAWRPALGFLSDNGGGRVVTELDAPPRDSLLNGVLDGDFDHGDSFVVALERGELGRTSARTALTAVLEGFMHNRPLAVSRLMAIRNVLVKPFGLRTSPLGCPVSSLLSTGEDVRFAGRFPVLDVRVDDDETLAEVILGADDKHLAFRSCVRVQLLPDGSARCLMGTRVRTRNLFGRVYMALIDRVHRGYISPAMLRLAVDHAVRTLRGGADAKAPGTCEQPSFSVGAT